MTKSPEISAGDAIAIFVGGVLGLAIVAVMFAFWSFALIWGLNNLLGFGIPLEFRTMAAAGVLIAVFRRGRRPRETRKS